MNEKEILINMIEQLKETEIIQYLYQYTKDFISLHSSVRIIEPFEAAIPSDQL